MGRRFMSIWFRHLMTDWMTLRHPELKGVPFVLTVPDHGRLLITAANIHAERCGVAPGMLAADAKAVTPGLEVRDDLPDVTPASHKVLMFLYGFFLAFTSKSRFSLFKPFT